MDEKLIDKLAIEVAEEIYLFVSELNEYDPDTLYKNLLERYKDFGKTFPTVIQKIVYYKEYSSVAFEKLLQRLRTNPGKGMEGVVECQAFYAKYLYKEVCRRKGRRYDEGIGKQVWKREYEYLMDIVRKIEKDEEEVRSEFDYKERIYEAERKKELNNYFSNNKELLLSALDNIEFNETTLELSDEVPTLIPTETELETQNNNEQLETENMELLTEQDCGTADFDKLLSTWRQITPQPSKANIKKKAQMPNKKPRKQYTEEEVKQSFIDPSTAQFFAKKKAKQQNQSGQPNRGKKRNRGKGRKRRR